MATSVKIIGTGSYIPGNITTNESFRSNRFFNIDGVEIEGSNKDIIDKFKAITGIEERKYVDNNLVTSDMAFLAAQEAIKDSKVNPEEIDYIVVAHVLLVPEKTKHLLKKVLIPTDFSADSATSFKETQTLIASSNGEVEALHVYNIPSFFFPYINTEKALNRTIKHLKEKVQQFRKRHKLSEDIPFKYMDRKDLSVVEAIEKHAERGDFDIIVVSARGGNKITSLFIGSITNDLLIRNRRMPLLVIN